MSAMRPPLEAAAQPLLEPAMLRGGESEERMIGFCAV
jgi:hypothetical protein